MAKISLFTLLSPLALFTLLALTLPIAIHLLSKHPGRVIPFAYIRLIAPTKGQPMTHLLLTERIVLALRLILLLLCTLLLAQLIYPAELSQQRPHVLVSQDWLNQGTDLEKKALVETMGEQAVILLDEGYPSLKASEIRAWQGQISEQGEDIWARISKYASRLAPGTPITVYSTNRLSQFLGQGAAIPHDLEWRIKQLPLNKSEALTQTIVLWVISDAATEDVLAYVKVALDSLTAHTIRSLEIHYLSYQQVLSKPDDSSIYPLSKLPNYLLYLSSQPIPGRIHNQLKQAGSRVLSANSDFSGDWSSALQQPQFPLLLAQWLFADKVSSHQLSSARLSSEQIQNGLKLPNSEQYAQGGVDDQQHPEPQTALVILLILIFCAERLFSEFRRTLLSKASQVLQETKP